MLALFLLLQAATANYYADGMKALEAQQYAQAAELFTKAVEQDPKDYAAHFHQALALSLSGKEAEAIPAYRKVLELKPGLYEAQLNLGILLVGAKQWEEAAKLLGEAQAAKPTQPRPALYLGDALFSLERYDAAAAEYRKAADADPKSAGAWLGLARSAARTAERGKAEEYFAKAAELEPAYKDAMLELGQIFEDNKQVDDAVRIYRQFPQNAAARERMGQLLLESGKAAEATSALEEAVKQAPTPANRLALAAAYVKNKQVEKALPLLEQAAATEPNDYGLRMFYGRALRDAKQYAPAAREFYKAAQLKADSREAWSELAGMLILLENYPQALAALDRVRALGEPSAAHHYFRAIVLDRMKEYKPALESYQQFLSMSKDLHPDEEFKARQRIRVIQKELSKR